MLYIAQHHRKRRAGMQMRTFSWWWGCCQSCTIRLNMTSISLQKHHVIKNRLGLVCDCDTFATDISARVRCMRIQCNGNLAKMYDKWVFQVSVVISLETMSKRVPDVYFYIWHRKNTECLSLYVGFGNSLATKCAHKNELRQERCRSMTDPLRR